jgi:hypothetical protein
MAIRNGKVANLPNDIRNQLNHRLLEGETARELAAWLNALPEVQSILGSQFNGSPISEVNLTHWRQGGYLQWLTERECFDSARALAEGDRDLATTGLSAERLLNVLTVRFGELLMRWDFSPNESVSKIEAFSEVARKARVLQGISRSLLAIHRIQSHKSAQRASAAPRASTAASDSRRPSPRPVTTKSGSEPRASGASEVSPKLPRISTPRPETSADLLRGLETKASLPILAPQRRPGAIPNILSRPIASLIIPSNISPTPFKGALDLDEIFAAV